MHFGKKCLLGLGLTLGFQQAFSQFNTSEADKFFEISKNLEIYTNVLKELNTFYVDPINPGKMTKTGLDAMLKELDPYTNFITEAEAEQFEMEFNGKYGGVGVIVRSDAQKRIVVADVHQNGPIDKAGIKIGDIVVSIDGNKVTGRNEDEVGLLLKGAPGSTLNVVIKNPVNGKESNKVVTRAEITIPPVPFSGYLGKDKKIAYVVLTQFSQHCSRDVKKALDSLKSNAPQGLDGVVLDLRSNPGGLITEAVNLCNLFLEKGQHIVSTKAKNKEWDKEYLTSNAAWDSKIPLTVLINGNSASASEIVSGTLQDLDRAVVVGSRSYGKGLVQVVRPVGYNSRLKVTTAKYYIPSGRCIQTLDYSHRNEDGTVAAVPDSLRKNFKTLAGRTVRDGGGIEPDVKIASEYYSVLTSKLVSDHKIFDYVTEYYHAHPQIASAKEFKFSDADYDQFLQWLNKKEFKYETGGEYLLENFKKYAVENKNFDKYKTEYNSLINKMNQEKKGDYQANKEEIKTLLAAEIVARYYYQAGQIEHQLGKENAALQKALNLLTTEKNEYQKILQK